MEESLVKIYKITCLENNYVYISSTSRELEQRFQEHLRPCKLKDNPNALFQKDIQKFGKDKFIIEQIDICFERHRFILEEYWWNKCYEENYLVYDIKRGSKHSENTKQRLSRARLNSDPNIYKNENFKEKISSVTKKESNGMYGKKDDNALNGRIVVAFSDKEHTNKVLEFPSVKVALSYLGLKSHLGLNDACRKNLLYHGYYWSKEWVNK